MDEILDFILEIKTAHREINRRFSEVVRPLGITPVQAEALLVLADDGPLTVGGLGERIVAESGNPSRLVDRMAATGLVERIASATDGRQVHIRLTRRGRQVASAILQERRPALEQAWRTMDHQSITKVTTLLRRIRGA